MTSPVSRTLAGAVAAAALLLWVWSFDLGQQNAGLRTALASASGQLQRLPVVSPPASVARSPERLTATPTLSEVERWRQQAAGYGSDARNMAQALQRVKTLCVAAGLADCLVRRAVGAVALPAEQLNTRNPNASALAQNATLTSYAVTLTCTFTAKGVRDLLARLAGSAHLYRLDRVNVLQNRAELDVVFFHSPDVRADPAQTPAPRAK